MRGKACGLLLIALAGSAVRPAAAQQQRSVGDKAAAEALFDHAKALMAQGRYAEACPKFAESQKLDAGIGTLLYMADCYEKNGQTASAWAGFREAAAAAKLAGQPEREKIARDRAAALEPTLSKLTITVEPANVLDGAIEVTRDGVQIGKALWGTPIPVDPGDHLVAAVAPGKKKWERRVHVQKDAASVAVHVPKLEDAAPAGPPDASPDDGGTQMGGQRALGLVAGGLGIAGIGVGVAFGLVAISKNDDADAFCRPEDPTRCKPEGVALSNDAHDAATVSTIAMGAGAAALVAGVVLFLTAPAASKETGGLRAAPMLGRDGRGIAVGGAF